MASRHESEAVGDTNMGEAARKRSATQKFIEQYPECCFCAGTHPSTTREHRPPKSLFDGSHRPDKLVMPACDQCNRGTSTADLTVAIISRWGYEPNHTDHSDHSRLVSRVRHQAPELFNEWTENDNPLFAMRGRQHLRSHGVPVADDAGIRTIGQETIRQLNLFAHKVVLGLYFEHFRQPLPAAGAFCAFWRTKEDYHNGAPQTLLDMLPKYATLTQGRWDVRETFESRHALNTDEGLMGFLARFRRGLFVSGFAVRNAAHVPSGDKDWMKPGNLLGLLESPRFRDKS